MEIIGLLYKAYQMYGETGIAIGVIILAGWSITKVVKKGVKKILSSRFGFYYDGTKE